MPVSALPQAPYRQDRKSFPTPLTTDVLFSEIRECNRSDFPAYGTPHPNKSKWPHHKLIFIKPVDIERNEIFEFFFAADRENQDLYNFSSGYRNIGGQREFKIVVREYVTLREDFNAAVPAFKAPMPNIPTGVFDGVSYFFFDKQQKKTDQPELDSLYVMESHTYVESALINNKISYQAQTSDLTPEKFRYALPRVTTESIVQGTAAVPSLSGDLLVASEDQFNPDVKVVKTVSGPRPTNSVVLSGTRSYVESTKAIVEETLSRSPIEADTGLLVAQSTVSPLGNGDYIKETVRVAEWPALVSSVWVPDINAQVKSTEQFIAPTAVDITAPNTSYKAVNKDRTLQTVTEVPVNVMSNFMMSFPSRMDIPLPNVLKSLSVVWNSDSAVGESIGDWNGSATGSSYSLSGSEGSTATSTASVRPELIVDIQQSWGSNIPVTIQAFFLPMVNNSITREAIMNRLGVLNEWPVFKPVAHTIVLKGAKVSVTARAQGSAAIKYSLEATMVEEGTTKGQDHDISMNTNAVSIPATIHGAIALDETSRVVNVQASAAADWNGYNFPSVHVHSVADSAASGSVYPTALAATSPSSIPDSGLYIMRTTVEPYNWGWAKCTAVILDASNLR